MAQLIQFKRRIPATLPAVPGTLAAGEPAVAISAGGVADLYVGDGAASRVLVSHTRQVELTGDQAITGEKTFSLTSFKLTGGDPNDAVFTDGTGNLRFEPISPGGLLAVNVSAPITGNGTSGSALAITRATDAQIATGTNNVSPIDSLGLRSQLGDDAADLTTTAKTVVPAINELDTDIGTLAGQVAALSGALRFVGNYDADASQVVSADAGTVTVGSNLPPASAANQGWFVIVTEPGTPTAPAPAIRNEIGDWIVSTGTAWIHVPLYHTAITAANVGITQINAQTWTNVQTALAGIYALAAAGLTSVAVDGVSIVGDGTVGDELEVATVDGGTY